jgi:hypothetical protein
MRASLLFMCISPPRLNEVENTRLKKWIQVAPVEAGPRLAGAMIRLNSDASFTPLIFISPRWLK